MSVQQQPRTMHEPGKSKPKQALDLPSRLASLYAPILPYLKWIKITRRGARGHDPKDILVPRGYEASVVVTGLNAPVQCCFDEQGFCYVTEAGHKIDAPPRILKVNVSTGAYETFFELPKEDWNSVGAMTGACWYQGHLYVMNTDTLLRIRLDGTTEQVLTDLPGRGDHQANYPVVGPDGKLYFAVGSATNTGIVGADNFAYEWLPKFPQFAEFRQSTAARIRERSGEACLTVLAELHMAGALSKREYSPGAHRGDATRATGAGAGRAARSGSRVAPAGGMVAAGRLLCGESTHATSAAVSTEDQMRPFHVAYSFYINYLFCL